MDETAALVYEESFVPALFAQWAGPVADALGIGAGDHVLDVACGTGVFAREAARRAAPGGSVTGLDASEGMLAVAARRGPGIEWRRGRAEELPFPDASFQAVACQFALMFFTDRVAALREMRRVLAPGGRLVVAVWASLDRAPGYAALVALLDRLFGRAAGDALRAPFALGDAREVDALFASAGLSARIETRAGSARFPSVRAWIDTDVRGWTPVGDELDADRFEELVAEAGRDLRAFVTPGGSVAFPMPAHLVRWTSS